MSHARQHQSDVKRPHGGASDKRARRHWPEHGLRGKIERAVARHTCSLSLYVCPSSAFVIGRAAHAL
eukprot:4134796-Alexandrium_andersonii.AAC.1